MPSQNVLGAGKDAEVVEKGAKHVCLKPMVEGTCAMI